MGARGTIRGASRALPVAATLVVLLALAATPAVAAPGGSRRGARPAQETAYTEVVDAVDNEFIPEEVTVAVGTTVMWTNNGRSPHNILPADKKQDFGAPFGAKTTAFGPGDDYEFTFTQPGTYAYYCSLHGTPTSGMIGTVVVGDGTATSGGSNTAAPTRGGTIRVPKDFATIQAAVDAAKPGALILVAPGTYHEGVTVGPGHENIVIRGESRSGTILDGRFSEEPGMENGIKVLADGVAVENMTAQNYVVNGFFWTGVDGYRGSYLTAVRNGDYGIYAFDSVRGQFDHAYGAGSPDAGFYIGQCTQCDALIVDSEAEWNGLGYSGTNAGGNLVITRSSWHHNRGGIVPNSGTGEANPPERETTIVGNLVYDNNNAQTAAIDIAKTAFGTGILVYGGEDNLVSRNRVTGHETGGIGVVPAVEKLLRPDNPRSQNFDAVGNRVTDNVVEGNRYDLVLISTIDDAAETGDNCFSGNAYTTSLPEQIESVVPCAGKPAGTFEAPLAVFGALALGEKPEAADYRTVPLPTRTDLPEMPKARTAKARPATNEPSIRVDLTKVKTPPPAK